MRPRFEFSFSFPFLTLCLLASFSLDSHSVSALSPQFLLCQVQKPAGQSPLEGCPAGTIYVSADSSESLYANFTKVQDAVDSLTDDGELAVILIGEGQYFETVNVTRSSPLTILGQLPSSYATLPISTPFANASQPNLVQIFNTVFVENGIDDAATAVLTVAPNGAAALIGAGTTGAPAQGAFGNVDFKMYNVDIQNRASLTFAISQALATDISYANASFYGCGFSSFQDTWYTGKNASTYVVDSVIFGQTDYLFGFGTAWFQNVILAVRGCGGGTAAWKGTNSSLTERVLRYGAYIADSQIIRPPDANATLNITDGCYLGRPWNDWAVTVYLNTFMEDIIQPVGWEAFDSARPTIMNTTFYAEYNSTGPGGDTSSRLSIEHLLTAEQAQEFTVDGVFLKHPSWIDYGYLY
ncbi:carbohydrate esterase family 8 protein [Lentinula edodes]|nr:carbohydrate esterase family 8 protein [Lentinula edodes]